jgi:hypothetical protein
MQDDGNSMQCATTQEGVQQHKKNTTILFWKYLGSLLFYHMKKSCISDASIWQPYLLKILQNSPYFTVL